MVNKISITVQNKAVSTPRRSKNMKSLSFQGHLKALDFPDVQEAGSVFFVNQIFPLQEAETCEDASDFHSRAYVLEKGKEILEGLSAVQRELLLGQPLDQPTHSLRISQKLREIKHLILGIDLKNISSDGQDILNDIIVRAEIEIAKGCV